MFSEKAPNSTGVSSHGVELKPRFCSVKMLRMLGANPPASYKKRPYQKECHRPTTIFQTLC